MHEVSRFMRYLFPPGSIKALVIYGLCVGSLAFIIRYFDLSDFLFPNHLVTFLTIVAVIFGPLAIMNRFHPEWRDSSKDDNFSAD
jgi:hypothetical protein